MGVGWGVYVGMVVGAGGMGEDGGGVHGTWVEQAGSGVRVGGDASTPLQPWVNRQQLGKWGWGGAAGRGGGQLGRQAGRHGQHTPGDFGQGGGPPPLLCGGSLAHAQPCRPCAPRCRRGEHQAAKSGGWRGVEGPAPKAQGGIRALERGGERWSSCFCSWLYTLPLLSYSVFPCLPLPLPLPCASLARPGHCGLVVRPVWAGGVASLWVGCHPRLSWLPPPPTLLPPLQVDRLRREVQAVGLLPPEAELAALGVEAQAALLGRLRKRAEAVAASDPDRLKRPR